MKSLSTYALAGLILLSSPTLIAKNNKGNTRICKKMEHCVLADMRSKGVPSNIIQMAKASVQGMCEKRQDDLKFYDRAPTKELETLAQQCLTSIEKSSCKTLMSKKSGQTTACIKFREASEDYDKKHKK